MANFYGAGGASQISASEQIPTTIKNKSKINNNINNNGLNINNNNNNNKKKPIINSNKIEHSTLKPGGVEMKVVRFDPNTAQGQAIADQHINDDATHIKPVTVGTQDDSSQYNHYLPLKVSGTSFPIPDVPELKDRKITSVVVLAPVDNSQYNDNNNDKRKSRKFDDPLEMKFYAGDILKLLVKKPTIENYKKWLEQESKTIPQNQSVILLVTT